VVIREIRGKNFSEDVQLDAEVFLGILADCLYQALGFFEHVVERGLWYWRALSGVKRKRLATDLHGFHG
jgi:hypothetical protein